MATKKKTKSWKDTYEFYGIKNYTWSKSMKNMKNIGFRAQTLKEWGMIGEALKSGKLSYRRFIAESFVFLALGFLTGMITCEFVIWMIG